MTTPESASLTPDILALIGKEWVFTAPEELGRASIRKFAVSIGDHNPLYTDQEYAGKSKYGGIIAPPTLVCETWQYLPTELDPQGSPVDRPRLHLGTEIRGGHEYTFLRPVRPEDVITGRWKVADIRERAGRTGKLTFLVMEITYSNQHGEDVAINKETIIFRSPDALSESQGRPEFTEEAPPRPEPTQPRRLETALRFDEIKEGDDIPPLCKDITMHGMVFYAAATWDFYRYHYDKEFVAGLGFPQPFVDGQMLGAYLVQMLSDWTGDPGAISKMDFRFRGFVYPGDSLVCRGQVAGVSSEGGLNQVECDLWIDNQHGVSVLAPAKATLSLP